MHILPWPIQALKAERSGFDAFAMCILPHVARRLIAAGADVTVPDGSR